MMGASAQQRPLALDASSGNGSAGGGRARAAVAWSARARAARTALARAARNGLRVFSGTHSETSASSVSNPCVHSACGMLRAPCSAEALKASVVAQRKVRPRRRCDGKGAICGRFWTALVRRNCPSAPWPQPPISKLWWQAGRDVRPHGVARLWGFEMAEVLVLGAASL